MLPLNNRTSISTRLSASVLAPLLFAVHTDAGPVDLNQITLLSSMKPSEGFRQHRKAHPDLPSRPSSLASALAFELAIFFSSFTAFRDTPVFCASRAFHVLLLLLGMLFSEIFKRPFPLI